MMRRFRKLCEKHRDRVYTFAWYFLGNREDAEDACQEVFISIRRALPKFRGESRLSTWVYRVAVNHALNRLKTLRRRGENEVLRDDGVEESADPGPHMPGSGERSPEHLAENPQLLRIVERKMEKLDPELRVILVLRDIQGMAYEEMSRVLDVPEGTIKSRLHRARNELKKQLAPYLG